MKDYEVYRYETEREREIRICQEPHGEQPAMDRITLFTTPDSQVNCKFTGPHAERITDLFGTDVLPSAFSLFSLYHTNDSLREDIRRQIAALNPGCDVQWEVK
jgi:hypothetical protein